MATRHALSLPPLPRPSVLQEPQAPALARPDTRTRLLEAALELVQKQGIQALTQARVAAAAGLRQSHLTYHFPTRAHLLTAVALHCAAGTMSLMCAEPDQALTLEAFRRHLGEHVSTTAMPRLMLALTVASEEDPSLKAWMAEFGERATAHLHGVFTQLGLAPTRTDVALFHASLVGICTLQVGAGTAWSVHSRELLEAAFDRLVTLARQDGGTLGAQHGD